MMFLFDDGRRVTEALVTGISLDLDNHLYIFTVLGLDQDRINYTEPGKAWIRDDELQDILDSDAIKNPHDIVGRKMKFVANDATERVKGEGNEAKRQEEFEEEF